jgi:Tol biopolymer transport system component
VAIAEDIQYAITLFRGNFDASRDGRLVYRSGGGDPLPDFAWLNRKGERIGAVGEPGRWAFVELSPDEKRLAGQVVDMNTGVNSLWFHDLERGLRTRFSIGNRADLWPVWSPDGRRIVYSHMTGRNWDLFLKPSDGGGTEEALHRSGTNKQATSWSPDGRLIAYTDFSPRRQDPNIFLIPVDGKREPVPFRPSSFAMRELRFSPDGKWALYLAASGAVEDVYVVPFPGPGGIWQVSVNGATWARWTKGGDEIVFRSPEGKIFAVPIGRDGSSLHVGAPELLFTQPLTNPLAMTRDGQRILARIAPVDTGADPLNVITYWPALLRR